MAVGVEEPTLAGVIAKGLPAREVGFGLDFRDMPFGVAIPLSFLPGRLDLGVAVPVRSLSFLGFLELGERPGVGVAGFGSIVEDGEEGFVPDVLGTLFFSFSSDFFDRDSASESVSSCY
jgi:hypothetical protein